jgi:hypothetical protein
LTVSGMSDRAVPERAVAEDLLSAAAVRTRAREILEAGLAGQLPHFQVDLAQLSPAASLVASVIRENYPDLNVPLHARWRHFVLGGRDLWGAIDAASNWLDSQGRARAAFDLAAISVLLDAGAGPDWRYQDAATGLSAGRSEGLALATLRMFEAGLFSADGQHPLRADALRLANLTGADLAHGFQVSDGNSLPGLEARAALIARLGRTVLSNAKAFASCDTARPGGLFDYLSGLASHRTVPAEAILHAVLTHLAPVWPGRIVLGGISLGDTWRHSAIKRSDGSGGLVPLHKLSQWLSYSLIEPMRSAGLVVNGIDALTGLAEYRNGGLFVDFNVIVPRNPAQALTPQPVDSEFIVEWRALTVALLDLLAPLVREKLGLPPEDFPLACLLEGGTWAAGRKIAKQKRADGGPPFTVISDGTVF